MRHHQLLEVFTQDKVIKMRFKPKQLGQAYTLDDYNATLYLLQQDKWMENNVKLSNSYTVGSFGMYTFQDPHGLLLYHDEDFVITTNREKYDEIIFEILNPLIPSATYNIKFKYRLPTSVTTNYGTIETGGVNSCEIIGSESYNEKAEIDKEDTSNIITMSSNIHEGKYKCKLPSFMVPGTKIFSDIQIEVNIHPQPEIDPWNGKANEPDEILVYPDKVVNEDTVMYTWDTLHSLITNTPPNGKKHIYRIMGNGHDIYLLNEIQLENGQNIEIRGGTNDKTIIDGTNCGRAFYVSAGAKLTLDHVQIQNCINNAQKVNEGKITIGRNLGGAIHVAYNEKWGSKPSWGICNVLYCTFKECSASHGGAIYSAHARLYVQNSLFLRCHSHINHKGGGILYDTLEEVDNI